MSEEFEKWYREFCGVDDPEEIVLYDGEVLAHFEAGQRAGMERAAEIAKSRSLSIWHPDYKSVAEKILNDIRKEVEK